jgi:hypothetical protein
MSDKKQPGRVILESFTLSVSLLFSGAWLSMLYIGAAHSQDHRIPTVGYWLAFFVLAAARSVWQAITYTIASKP